MKLMEEQNIVEKLVNHIKEYTETRYNIIILSIQDKFSNTLSSVISIVILGALVIFSLFFASISAAWQIGKYFHSPSIGFLCVSGFYILVTLILFFNRETWIKLPIINALIKKLNSDGIKKD